MSRQSNEIMAAAAPYREYTGPGPGKFARDAAREHCTSLGIDPDSVSDAVRQLSKKFKRGPLELLWQIADDESASKSARSAAAQAIMPYLQGKLAPVKGPEAKGPQTTGVMEVPMVASMEEWSSVASASQDALKKSVRE